MSLEKSNESLRGTQNHSTLRTHLGKQILMKWQLKRFCEIYYHTTVPECRNELGYQ
jgi:hypothetical protein